MGAVLLTLVGCTAGTPQEPGSADSAPSSQAAAPTALSCEAVAAVAGPITSELQFSAADSTDEPDDLSCVWISSEVAEASSDLDSYGSLAIAFDPGTWSDADLDSAEQMGTVVEDPRVDAVGGRLIVSGEGAALADAGIVQLLFPKGTVTIVTAGALLSAASSEVVPSVDDAVGVAASVAELAG